MASSSSAHKPQHHLLLHHGTTAAPPPTPSSQPNFLSSDNSTVDALASLLHRLPATLSLPSSRFGRRHSPSSATISTTVISDTPSISLSQPRANVLSALSTAASDHGFFQLTHHRLTSQLAESSESDSAALLALSSAQKRRLFPSNWPVGFDDENEPDDDPTSNENASFCLDLDSLTSIDPSELSVASLAELTRKLECLGAEVVEMLTCALGLDKPTKKRCSLMWVSEFDQNDKMSMRCYPYVVGLNYQIRLQEYRLDTDSGPVLVKPDVGSVLVTLGDIAQVWSNGKTKKVRGRPIPTIHTNDENSISMSLLVTLPLDSTISPILPIACIDEKEDLVGNEKKRELADDDESSKIQENRALKFNSIPFEDYAWRVYHERLFLKDSLDRYRIFD